MTLPDTVIDEAVLAELRELDRRAGNRFLDGIIDTFLQGTPGSLARMRAATIEGDVVALELEAHSLKGTCGHLGAVRMQSLCSELVERARDGAITGADKLVEQLEVELGRARIDLLARFSKLDLKGMGAG